MKKLISILSFFTIALILSFPAQAESGFDEPYDQGYDQAFDQGPAPVVDSRASCQPLADACYAAGYVPNGRKGRGMFESCMKPLMAGAVMRRVRTTPEAVQSCRDALKQGHQ